MLENPLLVSDWDNKHSVGFAHLLSFKDNELNPILRYLCLDLDMHILHLKQQIIQNLSLYKNLIWPGTFF